MKFLVVVTPPSIYKFTSIQDGVSDAVLDKCESNHTGDGQTDGKRRTEVRTGKIYEFMPSNVATPGVTETLDINDTGVTERRTIMPQVIIDKF